jgi:hypothetical protein
LLSKPKLLTKSRFKMATECPTKLFYTGKKEYGNNNLDNAFLEALAAGGFQVGELAKLYFPNGHMIETLDADEALERTNSLLSENEKVTIYEAAFKFDKFFVRADIVRKTGNLLELYEVKAKSFDPNEERAFWKKKSGLRSDWLPYLRDVAFQKMVIQEAYPQFSIEAHLTLANKSEVCTVEGLNQLFVLEKDSKGRTKSTFKGTAQSSICKKMLVSVPVDEEVELIWSGLENGVVESHEKAIKLEDSAKAFAEAYFQDKKIESDIASSGCKSCEFRIPQEMKESGLKSGFDECWAAHFNKICIKNVNMNELKVIDIWNFRGSSKLMLEGKYFVKDLEEEDLKVKESEKKGLSSSQRQWIQVQKAVEKTPGPHVEAEALSDEMAQWKFPLHFIDFETTMVALPFHKGRRPYEQIAFQFSHHILHENGTIEHAGEYINNERGAFPNYDFVRALKAQLEKDHGTVFRYSNHENTVLCQIYDQLSADENVADAASLQNFIKTLTRSKDSPRGDWEGARLMVDLCEVWKRYAYLPRTGGSNSIKKVLPAILNEKTSSIQKFMGPIYGKSGEVRSLNFESWKWIVEDDSGQVKDPYKLLPPVFEDLSADDLEKLENPMVDDELANGGAAMTAYAMMQFTEMSDLERLKVKNALLKYCELDTLAMVFVYLYFKDIVEEFKIATQKAA